MADQNNAPERLKDLIYRVLRDYRQIEVVDEEGDGYPLVDALTITGQGIDMGEREIANIADALAYEIARADRAAPERQVRAVIEHRPDCDYTHCPIQICDCPVVSLPAAPTDNTALVEKLRQRALAIRSLRRQTKTDIYDAELDEAAAAALASRKAPPAAQPVDEWDHCTCGPCPLHPAPADREALVRLLQIITRNGSLDDGRTLHEIIADALLARGLRLPGEETMAWAVGNCESSGWVSSAPPPACQQEAVTVAEDDILADAEAAYWADPNNDSFDRHCIRAALRALKGES